MTAAGRHPARWAALGLAAAAVGLVLVLATREPAVSRMADSPLLGRVAPPVAGETVDGTRYDSAVERGRWVVVNFFATWCVPCRREHGDLLRFQAGHASVGDATVVGVVYDDPAADVRRFRKEEGGDWPMVLDPKGRLALRYGVAGVPESYLVSPGGIVVAKIVGGVRYDDLERLLAEAKGASAGGRAS